MGGASPHRRQGPRLRVLRSQKLALKRGSVYALPLSETAKGQGVAWRNHPLLFIRPSPARPRRGLALPPEFRGTVWSSMDRVFFAILAALGALLHFYRRGLHRPSPPSHRTRT